MADTLTPSQVVSLVEHLPFDTRRKALFALAHSASEGAQKRRDLAVSHLRQLASDKSLNWDTMTDNEREQFIDELLHEGRRC